MPAEKREITLEAPPQACFDALVELLPALGYEVWKTRPMAYLVMARGQVAGSPATVNTVCSMFAPARVTVTCESSQASGEQLQAAASAILDGLAQRLSS